MTIYLKAADNAEMTTALKNAGVLDENGEPLISAFMHCCNVEGCGYQKISAQPVYNGSGEETAAAQTETLAGCYAIVAGITEQQATDLSSITIDSSLAPNIQFS